jgi:hypothetical protein
MSLRGAATNPTTRRDTCGLEVGVKSPPGYHQLQQTVRPPKDAAPQSATPKSTVSPRTPAAPCGERESPAETPAIPAPRNSQQSTSVESPQLQSAPCTKPTLNGSIKRATAVGAVTLATGSNFAEPHEKVTEVRKVAFDSAADGQPRTKRETKSQKIARYRREVSEGDPDAQFKLGNLYRLGEWGLEKDCKEAVRLFLLAAEQGHNKAQINLANSYFSGEGVETDVPTAITWYVVDLPRNSNPVVVIWGCCQSSPVVYTAF